MLSLRRRKGRWWIHVRPRRDGLLHRLLRQHRWRRHPGLVSFVLAKGWSSSRPWDCALCLRRCFSHRRWTSGLLVGGGVSGEGLLFPFPSLRDGGRCLFSVYDACWRSRRWFMRQIHALEPFVEEDGGSTLVGALVAGDRKLRAVARSWGCYDVNSSYSRVFLANFQECTVLFY